MPTLAMTGAWGQTSASEPKTTPATPAPPVYYPTAAPPMAPGPFSVTSADGKARLKVGGLIQFDGHFFASGGRTGNGGLVARRVRPILDGSFSRNIDFRLVPEFGEGRALLQDAFIDLKVRPNLRLRSGKYKVPYSLERLQMVSDVPFVERSIGNNVVPIRDVGFMLMKEPTKDGDIEWELGAYNGVLDSTSSDTNTDNGLDVIGRVFWQPKRGKGIGIAATSGSGSDSLSGQVFRSAGRSPFFRYVDGTVGNGKRTRLAPQFFYFSGAFGLQGEHLTTRQKIRRGDVATTDVTTGLYLQATYVLSGEKTSFRNVVPDKPFDFDGGGTGGGAWELAMRYSQVKTDGDTFAAGLADPAVSAQKATALTFGVNWYLTRQSKLMLNYEETDFGRPLRFTPGTRQRERAFLTRLQVQF